MFLKQNNEITYTASHVEAFEEIPLGTYMVMFNPMKGFYLEQRPDFILPPKIYGDSESISKRYVNTFNNQDGNLGILLTGLKGTGKSVTAKVTSVMSNRPIILVTEMFDDGGFKSFLSNITQEVVILIDEFEKVYPSYEHQNAFLSILDGVFEGKKMFIFTSNEKDRVNSYMLNRLGRIHYLKEYKSLDESIIRELLDDKLDNKSHIDEFMSVLNIIGEISMDMVIGLINEINLYDESPKEAIQYLNLKPEALSYTYDVFHKGKKQGDGYMGYHPLTRETFNIEFYADNAPLMNKLFNDYSNVDEFEFFEDDDEKVSEGDVAVATLAVAKPVDTKGYVSFVISVEDMDVSQRGKTILLTDKDKEIMIKFVKKEPYYFSF